MLAPLVSVLVERHEIVRVRVGFGDALVDDRRDLWGDVSVVERAVDHGPQLTTLGLAKL
ncbi:MAG: hypothetical protein FWH11_05925 [Micrococcales bacterium]|nr:hypothetical protein [Micrococcales bacterium]